MWPYLWHDNCIYIYPHNINISTSIQFLLNWKPPALKGGSTLPHHHHTEKVHKNSQNVNNTGILEWDVRTHTHTHTHEHAHTQIHTYMPAHPLFGFDSWTRWYFWMLFEAVQSLSFGNYEVQVASSCQIHISPGWRLFREQLDNCQPADCIEHLHVGIMHLYAWTHACVCTHTPVHAHKHTHTHTRSHTQMQSNNSSSMAPTHPPTPPKKKKPKQRQQWTNK